MRDVRPFVGAVLALVALALALLWGEPGGGRTGRGEARFAAPAPSAGAPLEATSANGEAAALDREASAEWPPGAVAEPPLAPSASLGDGVVVRVATTEDPDGGVAGAEVLDLVLQPGDLDRVRERLAEGADLPDTYAALARSRRRTDGAGRVVVPRPAAGILWALAARHGGRFAMVLEPELPPDGGEFVLLLPPARTVAVRVEEADGKPAGGVPVVFAEVDDDGRPQPRWTVRSDPVSGLAVFPNLEVFLPEAEPERRVAFLVAAPLREPPRLDTTWGELPSEPVSLRLPAHGALEVRLFTATGEPFVAQPVTVTAYPEPGPRERAPRRWRRPRERAADGVARFPVVAVGERVVVEALIADAAPFAEAVTVDGPERAGATRVVELRRAGTDPMVVGRALDGAGRRLAATELTWAARPASAFANPSGVVATDAGGRFVVTLVPKAAPASQPPFRLEVRSREEPGLGAAAALPALAPGAVVDVGDLRLEAVPVLVAGVVLDPEGRPFPNLRLDAVAVSPWGDGTVRTTLGEGTRSDGEGRFEIRAHPVPGASYRLAVSSPHVWAPETPFTPGETLRVTAWRHLSLSGRLRFGSVHPPAEVLGVEAAFTAPDGGERSVTAGVDEDGSFTLDGLLSGTASLRLFQRDLPGLDLARLEGVTVGGPEGEGDPRLDPWDLRGRIAACDLVVESNGSPPSRIEVRSPPTWASGRPLRLRAGVPHRIWLPGGPRPEVLVTAAGCLDRVVHLDVPTTRVLLTHAPLLTLRVTGLEELPNDVRAERVTAKQGARTVTSGRPGPGSRMRLTLPHGGRWAVTLRLVGPGRARAAVPLGTIEWSPKAPQREFVLRAAPERLAAAVAELRERGEG